MIRPNIHSFESLNSILTTSSRLVCLYSGGLDSTYLLYRLSQLKCAKIIALTVDLGGDFKADSVRQRANFFGAQSIIQDHRTEFVYDFVLPAIAAQANYLGGHPICASLSRPLMARVAGEVAEKNSCDIIIHTSNRSQNSLRRFNGALASLGFYGNFGSPFELSSISREMKVKELQVAGIQFSDNPAYSTDVNLWGREFEYGDIDDPEQLNIPEHLYEWTKLSADSPRNLCISFCNGIPNTLDGELKKDCLSIIYELNKIVGSYGLGRYTGLEEIKGGVKVQETREMPAAFLLFDAYRRLESACLNAECIREKMHIEQLWVRESVEGRWYEPLRHATQAFIQTIADKITGSVRYRIENHNLQFTSIKVENPLYIRHRSQYESGS